MSFQNRLHLSMVKTGYTQTSLADAIGVTRAAVSYWLTAEDDTRYPSAQNLNKCAEVLGVDPVWLRFGNPNETLKQNVVALSKKQSIITTIPVLSLSEIGKWIRSTTQGKGKMQAQEMEGNTLFNIELDNVNMIDNHHPSQSLYPGTILTFETDFCPKSIKSGTIVVAQFGMTDNFKIRQYQKDGNDEFLKTFNPDIPITPIDDNVKIVGICVYQSKKML